MAFQKGVSGNPSGRTPGSKNIDRQNYLDFQVWFKKVCDDIELVDEPEKRIGYSMSIIDKLMAKIQVLPGSPKDSLDNATARQEMINALENGPTPEGKNAAVS